MEFCKSLLYNYQENIGTQMKLTFRPASAKEAWDFLIGRHKSYHQHLKHFGYKYDMFIPDNDAMREMYDQPNLTPEQTAKYRDIFLNQIYNINDLQQLDSVLASEAIPALQTVNDVFTPLAKQWGITLPPAVEIVTHYGYGGSYDYENPAIIFRMFRKGRYNPANAAGLLQHEFIHILIEKPIIKKYNVPQDLKERIVDIIGFEYFGIPVQSRFEKSFANKYITKETIEKDLPGAVQKMMSDYSQTNGIIG